MSELPPVVAEIVGSRRLGTSGGAVATFTVAKSEALLALRGRPLPNEWWWTLPLLRAANAISERPAVFLSQAEEDEHQVDTLTFVVPEADLSALELRDLLGGALEDDLGGPLEGETRTDQLRRFRRLLGKAANDALASDLRELEILTPVGGRRFIRREEVSEDLDPYSARNAGTRSRPGTFVVRRRTDRRGVAGRFGRWLAGQSDDWHTLTRMWRRSIVGASGEDIDGDDGAHGMSLVPMLPGRPEQLGALARWGRAPHLQGLWLVRDGIAVARLDESIAAAGIPPGELAGWVECPRLRLTADEGKVVQDATFQELVAWLADAMAHIYDVEDEQRVVWPTQLEGLPTASGRVLSLAALQRRAAGGQDLLFVWPHQQAGLPASVGARVVAASPSHLALARDALPGVRFVPLRALGARPTFTPVDLTSLDLGSLSPLPLVQGSPFEGPEGARLRLSLTGYVHRYTAAIQGATVLLAFEREVSQLREFRFTIPGLTLLARIEAEEGQVLDLESLQANGPLITAIGLRCKELADEHLDALLGHVMSTANPWENPLTRVALEQLSAVRLGLRYVERRGGLALVWEDHPLLHLRVGETHEGQPMDLGDALRRVAEIGFIVLSNEGRGRWRTLESEDEQLKPWKVEPYARPLFDRVVGPGLVLTMPAVPEAYPLLKPAAEQGHLLLDASRLEQDLGRHASDPDARLRLAGHLLVARAQGHATRGLDAAPLFLRYDPRAAAPSRLVSLEQVLAERTGIAVPGAVSRDLPGPAIEAPPGLARLLHEVVGLHPEVAPRPSSSMVEGRIPGPVRKRGRQVPPLITKPVIDNAVVGSLRIAGDGSSPGVDLWERGLKVGELRLPEPLGRVSGRLWIAARIEHRELEKLVTEHAVGLLAAVVEQRFLAVPDSTQREKLEALVDYARKAVLLDDRLGLAHLLGVDRSPERQTETALDRSLRAWPLHRLPDRDDIWLEDAVVQSLGMHVILEKAMLSWKAARITGRRANGTIVLELGLRNTWINRATRVGSSERRVASLEAAVVILAEFFRQTADQGTFVVSNPDRAVAYWRLLALLIENVGD